MYSIGSYEKIPIVHMKKKLRSYFSYQIESRFDMKNAVQQIRKYTSVIFYINI
jgi:hypothetical protein